MSPPFRGHYVTVMRQIYQWSHLWHRLIKSQCNIVFLSILERERGRERDIYCSKWDFKRNIFDNRLRPQAMKILEIFFHRAISGYNKIYPVSQLKTSKISKYGIMLPRFVRNDWTRANSFKRENEDTMNKKSNVCADKHITIGAANRATRIKRNYVKQMYRVHCC